MHSEPKVDLQGTLAAAVLALAGVAGGSAGLIPGPNDELLVSLEQMRLATALSERVVRREVLRYRFVLRAPDGQRAWFSTEFLPAVVHHWPPSTIRSREAKRRLGGLRTVAACLNTTERELSDPAAEFLASIGVEPRLFWLDQARKEFPSIQLPCYGPWPDPSSNPRVRRARAVAVRAETVPFNSPGEDAVVVDWIDAMEKLEGEVVRGYGGKAVTAGLANAATIENARLLRWAYLRGILVRRRDRQLGE